MTFGLVSVLPALALACLAGAQGGAVLAGPPGAIVGGTVGDVTH